MIQSFPSYSHRPSQVRAACSLRWVFSHPESREGPYKLRLFFCLRASLSTPSLYCTGIIGSAPHPFLIFFWHLLSQLIHGSEQPFWEFLYSDLFGHNRVRVLQSLTKQTLDQFPLNLCIPLSSQLTLVLPIRHLRSRLSDDLPGLLLIHF